MLLFLFHRARRHFAPLLRSPFRQRHDKQDKKDKHVRVDHVVPQIFFCCCFSSSSSLWYFWSMMIILLLPRASVQNAGRSTHNDNLAPVRIIGNAEQHHLTLSFHLTLIASVNIRDQETIEYCR
jgi:hypothetical protein